jgi:prevent-host-death family protein
VLRQLRQQASELVRRVELGESFTVTASGRPAAKHVPAERNRWCRFDDIKEVFEGPADLAWPEGRDRPDAAPRDPWPRQ